MCARMDFSLFHVLGPMSLLLLCVQPRKATQPCGHSGTVSCSHSRSGRFIQDLGIWNKIRGAIRMSDMHLFWDGDPRMLQAMYHTMGSPESLIY